MTLAEEDMACWLNAQSVLWHPALLWQAQGPPRCDSTYDHEQPRPHHVYALPQTPDSYLPEDWEQRVKAAGAIVFRATPDRAATLANLRAALTAEGAPSLGWRDGLDLDESQLGPWFGLGLGYLLLAALAEAMEHENLLEPAAFWDDVQFATALYAGYAYTPLETNVATGPPRGYGDYDSAGYAAPGEESYYEPPPPENEPPPPENEPPAESESPAENEPLPPELPSDWRQVLQSAATKLLSAREMLYPVTIHLLEMGFLDAETLAQPWPSSLAAGVPLNLIASTHSLERLAAEQPDKLAALREAVAQGRAEVCGGSYLERPDPLLPIDSQLWNLRHGLDRARELLDDEVRVYARKRFGYHPHLPLFLSSNGITRALFLTFDESAGLPHYQGPVVSWPSPDGKQVDAFVRAPKPLDAAETFFNLGHHWFKTTREDHAAVLALQHTDRPDAPWCADLMELARLAPLLGTWETFSQFFSAVTAGEYPSVLTADDFHSDFLSERIEAHQPNPVSTFARHLRTRRRIDACWTYAALHRSLSGVRDTLDVEEALRTLEAEAERGAATSAEPAGLVELERKVAVALAERLQVRAVPGRPGWMILNPCAFARRAALEMEGASHLLPLGGPVKACQLDGTTLRAVVEVPALGFVWLPRAEPPSAAAVSRSRLGDEKALSIRNEFFEAEVDPGTGGLRALRDQKTRMNRVSGQLVFKPGSRMVARSIQVTSTGPALGEIVSEGVLLGEQGQELTTYRQRLRAWLGRPLLEMRIELSPTQPAAGYGWHAYYGARFAWRDERLPLVRGVAGTGYVSLHPRPQTPDYLEIREPPQNMVIFPGGLPFHQRQGGSDPGGGRMLDVILMPEGEKADAFDLGISLDREVPMQTALGYTSPLAIVPTEKGPPHIGASGWLFHVDASNLLMTRLVPGAIEVPVEGQGDGEPAPPPGPRDAVTARFLECAGYSGLAEFRCVRDPKRAVVLDARGQFMLQAGVEGDAVHLEVSPNDLVQVQVEFS